MNIPKLLDDNLAERITELQSEKSTLVSRLSVIIAELNHLQVIQSASAAARPGSTGSTFQFPIGIEVASGMIISSQEK